tara:strand:+ start:418 stop:594 length:177 start_codon:yes stop_codon:yes gene_type:complete
MMSIMLGRFSWLPQADRVQSNRKVIHSRIKNPYFPIPLLNIAVLEALLQKMYRHSIPY